MYDNFTFRFILFWTRIVSKSTGIIRDILPYMHKAPTRLEVANWNQTEERTES